MTSKAWRASVVCDQAHQCSFNHDEYREQYVAGSFGPFNVQARRLAALELNALIEGALEGGATDFWAWDGHCRFPGGLDIELLHPVARMVINAGDGGPLGWLRPWLIYGLWEQPVS